MERWDADNRDKQRENIHKRHRSRECIRDIKQIQQKRTLKHKKSLWTSHSHSENHVTSHTHIPRTLLSTHATTHTPFRDRHCVSAHAPPRVSAPRPQRLSHDACRSAGHTRTARESAPEGEGGMDEGGSGEWGGEWMIERQLRRHHAIDPCDETREGTSQRENHSFSRIVSTKRKKPHSHTH